jgi:hypothetical protein
MYQTLCITTSPDRAVDGCSSLHNLFSKVFFRMVDVSVLLHTVLYILSLESSLAANLQPTIFALVHDDEWQNGSYPFANTRVDKVQLLKAFAKFYLIVIENEQLKSKSILM